MNTKNGKQDGRFFIQRDQTLSELSNRVESNGGEYLQPRSQEKTSCPSAKMARQRYLDMIYPYYL